MECQIFCFPRRHLQAASSTAGPCGVNTHPASASAHVFLSTCFESSMNEAPSHSTSCRKSAPEHGADRGFSVLPALQPTLILCRHRQSGRRGALRLDATRAACSHPHTCGSRPRKQSKLLLKATVMQQTIANQIMPAQTQGQRDGL